MTHSISRLIKKWNGSYKNRTAIQYLENKDVVSVTYGQLYEDIYSFAGYLQGNDGHMRGKHVAIFMSPSYEFIVSFFAVLVSGGYPVLCNLLEPDEVLLYQLKLVDVDVIIAGSGTSSKKLELVNEYRVISWLDHGKCDAQTKPITDSSEQYVYLFTSGTMGMCKAVEIPVANLIDSAKGLATKMILQMIRYCFIQHKIQTIYPFYHLLPIYHVGGMVALMGILFSGQLAALSFNMKYINRELKVFNCVGCITFPAVLDMFANDIAKGRNKISDMKVLACGAAALNDNTRQILTENNYFINQAYGMTEFGITNYYNGFNAKAMKSVGSRISCFREKIIDGEVCIKPKRKARYYGSDEPFLEDKGNGWLGTGDWGYFDKHGNLFITGRKKNTIILSNGENVSPEELEEQISLSPHIDEVMVKEEDGKIIALIYARQGNDEEIAEFFDELNRGLPSYKKIARYRLMERPFERTALGKIKRF